MRLTLLVASAAASAMFIAAPAVAQSMNAETFFQKAKALQRKGMMALLSRDVKLLIKEATAAGETARAQRLAALKAKLTPRYCPPPGARRMGSDEFMDRLGSMSRAERLRIDMTEALVRMQVEKFPCR